MTAKVLKFLKSVKCLENLMWSHAEFEFNSKDRLKNMKPSFEQMRDVFSNLATSNVQVL